MENRSVSYFVENLDAMRPVKDALFQKRNSSVFDKLCVKLNNLFNSFCNEVTVASPEGLDFLKALKQFAEEMIQYKEYLMHVAESNGLANNQQSTPEVAPEAKEVPMFTPEGNIVGLEQQKQRQLNLNNVNNGSAA